MAGMGTSTLRHRWLPQGSGGSKGELAPSRLRTGAGLEQERIADAAGTLFLLACYQNLMTALSIGRTPSRWAPRRSAPEQQHSHGCSRAMSRDHPKAAGGVSS
ncbi:unnamed protein product [Discosporangium mesarthrocarpum]